MHVFLRGDLRGPGSCHTALERTEQIGTDVRDAGVTMGLKAFGIFSVIIPSLPALQDIQTNPPALQARDARKRGWPHPLALVLLSPCLSQQELTSPGALGMLAWVLCFANTLKCTSQFQKLPPACHYKAP